MFTFFWQALVLELIVCFECMGQSDLKKIVKNCRILKICHFIVSPIMQPLKKTL